MVPGRHFLGHAITPARLRCLAAWLLLLFGMSLAHAQTWPTRPVRIVVPFPPGGATDIVGRVVAEKLAARIGQPVIVENRPGAGTAIGVDAVVRAEPDGHTLLVSGSSSYTVVPALRAKPPYDPLKDLAPLALVANAPLVVVTAAAKPYRSIGDVLAAARAAPAKLSYSTFGAGTAPHLAGAMLADAAGIAIDPVPYKGSAEALLGVMRGEVDLGIDTLAAVGPGVKSGKLRVLATVGRTRTPFMPEVPGMHDLKLEQAAFDGFYAVAAPARTPPALLERIGRELAAVMAMPEVKQTLAQQALEATSMGPAALRALMQADLERYRAIGRRIHISLD